MVVIEWQAVINRTEGTYSSEKANRGEEPLHIFEEYRKPEGIENLGAHAFCG